MKLCPLFAFGLMREKHQSQSRSPGLTEVMVQPRIPLYARSHRPQLDPLLRQHVSCYLQSCPQQIPQSLSHKTPCTSTYLSEKVLRCRDQA